MAKFDRLVATTNGEFIIYDWKTGFREPKLQQFKASWQTAVYPYVLVEGGEVINGGQAIASDRVIITYWHAQYPQVVHRFPHNEEQHVATRGAPGAGDRRHLGQNRGGRVRTRFRNLAM